VIDWLYVIMFGCCLGLLFLTGLGQNEEDDWRDE
jgi:hypothetical protein